MLISSASQVLDSSFAKAPPTYSTTKEGKKDVKATPKKGKDKKGKASETKGSTRPPSSAVVGPSVKMKKNPAMAMALAAPQPRPGKSRVSVCVT